ncbi:beta-galactosidase family protein [Arthrobacter sp. RCC_34]|uniref:glycoside hydrolase family 35 protein n=1 Tax=Arthrobacter sp. RCC_34 TaxID=3239230 RepID=UPI0035261516
MNQETPTLNSRWIDSGRVLSGAIHYFRIHPDLWLDRLQRLAAMGATHVETYVPWNFHEREKGSFEFDGWRDLPRFIRLAEHVGLAVIVRPGPFICAEWDNGGLPTWLLYNGPIALRTSDPNFLAHVDAWFDELIPRLALLQRSQFGPVVAVQVENEYGSFGSDRDYLEHLRDGLISRGIEVPLFTSDGPTDLMLDAGTLPDLDVTANFGSGADEAVKTLSRRRPGSPFMCAEFWGGWFDHWGREHHTRPADDMIAAIEPILAAGGSINIYMAHGGTSFGTWPGANIDQGVYLPTVTSYDSDAPIGEAGELTGKFWKLRHLFGSVTGAELPTPPPLPRRQPPRSTLVSPVGPLLPVLKSMCADVRRSPVPLTQEDLHQASGLTLYEADLPLPEGASVLRIHEPRDRAWVFLDDTLVHRVDRNTPDPGLPLEGVARDVHLAVLVENEGRVNFGRHLGESKGLLGGASIHAHGVERLVHGWTQRPIDLQEITEFPEVPNPASAQEPGLFRTRLRCSGPADAFLALPDWEKAYVWLNGFLLGRIDARGPQRTLYAPGPLWRVGSNTIEVLSLGKAGAEIQVLDRPDLGGPTPIDGAER